MSVEKPLNVVLYWHMHQPEYRDAASGEYRLPWTYLHVIKDYVDMVAHLEAHPMSRAIVNFAPVLLEQIEDYANQVKRCLKDNSPIRDPHLAALTTSELPSKTETRLQLIKDCLRAHKQRMIDRFPAYRRLEEIARWLQNNEDAVKYMDDQYLVDLIVWHHLAWIGETVRRRDTGIKQMIKKGRDFNLADRWKLMEVIGTLLTSVIERYRSLAERGQIELSVTPYTHPIVPLMLDIQSAREALPKADLPEHGAYPEGLARTRWQFEKALETFERYFGFRPAGCWPSEGSVSEAALSLLDEFGFRWTASGGNVLRNSLKASNRDRGGDSCLHRVYRLDNVPVNCFFRDDGLSDLIGFTYSKWHADDAVANLIHHLGNIAKSCHSHPDAVVSIILDGENAWEHYPENGYYFLKALYRELSDHPGLEMTTYSRLLDRKPAGESLSRLVAGSWVYGTFSTWIGDKDKNRGWDMLIEAKQRFDAVMQSGCLNGEQRTKAEQQLAICEGSDWFWWFGDYNSAEAVSDFESLYRDNLAHLYRLLGETPPDYLYEVFTHGKGEPAMGGTMRPGQEPS